MSTALNALAALRAVHVAAIALIDAELAGVPAPAAAKAAVKISRGNQNYFEVDVDSTNLSKVKYWKNTKTLRVTFKNGSEYDYYDVPADVVQDLITASSVGSYHNSKIREVYRFARV